MKKLLAVTALMIFSSTLAFAQTSPSPRDDNATTTGSDEPHRNWSWLGLIGLAGLAGLRRPKTEAARSFEGRGVNVKAV